jgi:hypothetical protein
MKNEVDRRLFLKWANLVGIAAWFQPVAGAISKPLQDAKPVHPQQHFPREGSAVSRNNSPQRLPSEIDL